MVDSDNDGALGKHSVLIAGHATSVTLERIFWDLLCREAKSRNQSVNELVTEIDRHRDGNLSSAIRVFLAKQLRRQIPEERA